LRHLLICLQHLKRHLIPRLAERSDFLSAHSLELAPIANAAPHASCPHSAKPVSHHLWRSEHELGCLSADAKRFAACCFIHA